MDADLRPGGDRHERCATRPASRPRCAGSSTEGGFGAFTTNFEDLGGLRQLPGLAVQRLMADGYGFGGEGDWKTSALLRVLKVAGAGLPGGTSFMEDYTYDLVGSAKILGAHMLEVCPTIAGEKPRIEVHPLGIGGREDPARLVFDAAPAPGVVVGWSRPRRPVPLGGQRDRRRRPDEPLPNLPVARAVWEPRPDFATATEGWLTAGGPHHTVLSTAAGRRRADRPGRGVLDRAGAHRRRHHAAVAGQGAPLERGLPPPQPAPVITPGSSCLCPPLWAEQSSARVYSGASGSGRSPRPGAGRRRRSARRRRAGSPAPRGSGRTA